jgi:hypothetical protein
MRATFLLLTCALFFIRPAKSYRLSNFLVMFDVYQNKASRLNKGSLHGK